MTHLRREWLGTVPYAEMHERQRARRDQVIAGQAPEAFWLLEHPSVITTGRRPPEGLPGPELCQRLGTTVVATERGGLATWHGPGQLVGYPILSLDSRGLGVRRYVHALEQGLIDWLVARGVAASRRCGTPGVFVGTDKIASIGLHVSHRVTMHGFALNLTNRLDVYGAFVPCGLTDTGVTTLVRELGTAPDPRAAADSVGASVVTAILREAG